MCTQLSFGQLPCCAAPEDRRQPVAGQQVEALAFTVSQASSPRPSTLPCSGLNLGTRTANRATVLSG